VLLHHLQVGHEAAGDAAGRRQDRVEQIVGDMLARARKADQEALLLQVAYSSLQAYQASRGA